MCVYLNAQVHGVGWESGGVLQRFSQMDSKDSLH